MHQGMWIYKASGGSCSMIRWGLPCYAKKSYIKKSYSKKIYSKKSYSKN